MQPISKCSRSGIRFREYNRLSFPQGQAVPPGYNIVKDPVHVHDFQATLLHLLGIDHEKLTYRYQGRNFRLTDVHGHIISPLLA
jgi:hypothetical protein